jgi:FkbM family methyltransferase
MIKKFSYAIYKLILLIDYFFKIATKRSFFIWFKHFIQNDSYKSITILDKEIKFFVPTQLTEYRVDTFFNKEPETLEWIDTFKEKENLIFWDIGANIGLYSIYNTLKNKSSTTISFEPSSSNLRVLSRNISINNMEKNIKIFPMPLTNKENVFLTMNEGDFVEGGALNSFGEKFDFEGKEFESKMKYQVIGTSINYLISNNILEIPDYIKIDVDGIEHLILEGANKYLKNKKIKSLSIEINENFTEQYQKVLNIMKQNEFKVLSKKHNEALFDKSSRFAKTFNYVFVR